MAEGYKPKSNEQLHGQGWLTVDRQHSVMTEIEGERVELIRSELKIRPDRLTMPYPNYPREGDEINIHDKRYLTMFSQPTITIFHSNEINSGQEWFELIAREDVFATILCGGLSTPPDMWVGPHQPSTSSHAQSIHETTGTIPPLVHRIYARYLRESGQQDVSKYAPPSPEFVFACISAPGFTGSEIHPVLAPEHWPIGALKYARLIDTLARALKFEEERTVIGGHSHGAEAAAELLARTSVAPPAQTFSAPYVGICPSFGGLDPQYIFDITRTLDEIGAGMLKFAPRTESLVDNITERYTQYILSMKQLMKVLLTLDAKKNLTKDEEALLQLYIAEKQSHLLAFKLTLRDLARPDPLRLERTPPPMDFIMSEEDGLTFYGHQKQYLLAFSRDVRARSHLPIEALRERYRDFLVVGGHGGPFIRQSAQDVVVDAFAHQMTRRSALKPHLVQVQE